MVSLLQATYEAADMIDTQCPGAVPLLAPTHGEGRTRSTVAMGKFRASLRFVGCRSRGLLGLLGAEGDPGRSFYRAFECPSRCASLCWVTM